MKPQMESKGAAVGLAFMAGVCVGLVEHAWSFAFMALILAAAAIWQYRLEP